MNKTAVKVLSVAIISVALIGFGIKPLLIRYYINKYQSASTRMGSSSDITEIQTSIKITTACLRELERLGHIESYSIPIQSMHVDAETRVEMISFYSMSQNVVTILSLQKNGNRTELRVIDRAGNRKHWELIVGNYLEAK